MVPSTGEKKIREKDDGVSSFLFFPRGIVRFIPYKFQPTRCPQTDIKGRRRSAAFVLANERASIRMKEEQFSSELEETLSRGSIVVVTRRSTFENVGAVAICVPARVYVYYNAG